MTTKRKSISKKIRFEVFKRDSFTCQYCGRKSPDIILEIDHIKPISKSGKNDMMNLITSCFECNRGKGAKKLTDSTEVSKKMEQAHLLQERREQLKMALEWQEKLFEIENETAEKIKKYFENKTGAKITEIGFFILKQLLSKYDFNEVINAINIAIKTYPNIQTAFNKIRGVCYMKKLEMANPDLGKLYYIRGILRKRFYYCNDRLAIIILKNAYKNGLSIETLEQIALDSDNWDEWKEILEEMIEEAYIGS